MGLFGLGGDAPAEESPTAGLPKPSDDSSTQPPKAFQGQGENDTEQRMESSFSDSPPGSATQVGGATALDCLRSSWHDQWIF